jgi:CheY-like chemotaxis protein
MTMRAVAADVPVIMVVEDERITALDLKRRLESFGYHVPPIASTGAEAILRAAETRPDLILMDIMLKGPIDGITAAQQIRLTCDIPTVFLTAYSDEATIERAKETQPLGYLLKPFEEGSLRSTIEIALNNRALQRHLRSSEESLRRQNQYFNSMHELALSLLNRLDLEPLLESIVLRTAVAAEPSGAGGPTRKRHVCVVG